MYLLVRARHRIDRRAGRWQDVDLANELVSTLSTKFGDVYLYIEYPGQGTPVLKALHWDNVRSWLNDVSPTMTVQQWLTSLGNRSLPFDNSLPNETLRLVKYAQAWHCGYNLTPVGRAGHVDQLNSKFVKEDLVLTHPKHNPEKIRDWSMVSVNGYFHLTDWTDSGVRIIDGNKTIRSCNDNQIGIYSFETIGKLKYVPITEDMISGQNENSSLWDCAYITMPENIDITNKTVLLVTGGYLNVLSDVYLHVSPRTWRINFGNMMFLDRFIESVRELDLSSLGLSIDPLDPTFFSVPELKDNSVIKAYLTLSQSFMVVVDSPSFFQEYVPVESLGLPNRFVSDTYERIPLVGAYGRMIDYHVIDEPGKKTKQDDSDKSFVYCGTRNVRHDFDANHRQWPNQPIVNGGRYPAQPFKDETAYLRYLGVEG